YPSEFRLDSAVFDSGHVTADGRADFLAEPNPTFIGSTTFERIALDYFNPITNRYNVSADGGMLSAQGEFELAAEVHTVELKAAPTGDIKRDSGPPHQTAPVEQQQVAKPVQAARAASDAPDLLLKIARLHIVRGTFGYESKSTKPPYRVFLNDADL